MKAYWAHRASAGGQGNVAFFSNLKGKFCCFTAISHWCADLTIRTITQGYFLCLQRQAKQMTDSCLESCSTSVWLYGHPPFDEEFTYLCSFCTNHRLCETMLLKRSVYVYLCRFAPGDRLWRRSHICGSSKTKPDLSDGQLHAAGVGRRRHEGEVFLQVIWLHPFILQSTREKTLTGGWHRLVGTSSNITALEAQLISFSLIAVWIRHHD